MKLGVANFLVKDKVKLGGSGEDKDIVIRLSHHISVLQIVTGCIPATIAGG